MSPDLDFILVGCHAYAIHVIRLEVWHIKQQRASQQRLTVPVTGPFMLTFIDLFCGGGFGARGAVRGGGRPILAVDAWELATHTYQANFPKSDIITDPIENIVPSHLSSRYAPDVLLTSPECTAHSIARGARPGSEKSRETAIAMIPWIEAFQPRWVVVENVNRMKKWDRHEELLVILEDLGYKVSQLILDAADFGTPQSRKRLFLICDREGSKTTKVDLLALHRRQRKTAREILAPEGTYRSTPLYKPGRATATIERAERAMNYLGRGVPFLIVYYGSDYAGGWQSLDAPLRTVTTIDRFGLVTWNGNTPMLRMLQPDELVRAMGAAPSHKLPFGTRRDKVKLCGNGVCSPVMEIIFRRLEQLSKLGNPVAAAV